MKINALSYKSHKQLEMNYNCFQFCEFPKTTAEIGREFSIIDMELVTEMDYVAIYVVIKNYKKYFCCSG